MSVDELREGKGLPQPTIVDSPFNIKADDTRKDWKPSKAVLSVFGVLKVDTRAVLIVANAAAVETNAADWRCRVKLPVCRRRVALRALLDSLALSVVALLCAIGAVVIVPTRISGVKLATAPSVVGRVGLGIPPACGCLFRG